MKDLEKVLNEREYEAYEMQMTEENDTGVTKWRAYRRAVLDIANDMDIKLKFKEIENENRI